MTPCKKLGYKVGDKFTVGLDTCGFKKGQEVTLFCDDDSNSPLFCGENGSFDLCNGEGGAYLRLDDVVKIEDLGKPIDSVGEDIEKRGEIYGYFADRAELSQRIKEVFIHSKQWKNLDADQAEALDMIAHKISRILNGDPDNIDSWHDIAGYAMLVEKRLKGVKL